jgi:ubiquinone/menaquinone biosynthesis C-methylase UbiE
MITEVKLWWEKAAEDYQRQCRIPIDILYGPGASNEDELQLIGLVAGKHVLEIGCGGAQAAIAFAKRSHWCFTPHTLALASTGDAQLWAL